MVSVNSFILTFIPELTLCKSVQLQRLYLHIFCMQVIVLAKVIPDEEQAVISAAGIKLISDVLHESKSSVVQALAADIVARLAHTRAGGCGLQ